MPGSGGALPPRPRAKTDTHQEIKHKKITEIDVASGRETRDTEETEEPVRSNPWRLSGTWVQAEGGKGGGN